MNNPHHSTFELFVISLDSVCGISLFPDYPYARILVDGEPFVEKVRVFKKCIFEGDKKAGLARACWYLHPRSLIEYFIGFEYGSVRQIALIGCTCLDEDCWSLICSIGPRIRWSWDSKSHQKALITTNALCVSHR